MEEIKKRLDILLNRITQAQEEFNRDEKSAPGIRDSESEENRLRRVLHGEISLLRLDIEEMIMVEENKLELLKVIDSSIEKLNICPVRRRKKDKAWWYSLDIIFRFVGVVMGIVTFGILVSLPIILVRSLDGFLLRIGLITPFQQVSELLKRWVCRSLLSLSGVEVVVDDAERGSFAESCVLLTFAHSSNLDGFLVSSTCPIGHFALAKKELFLVPFFSWISLAIGGVPVDRKNRERAINALKRSAASVRNGNMALVIAPEGTRSTTGQLLEFKKGPFYIWEMIQSPIYPMVSYGGYDLYPVGSWVNNTGKIYVRYLKPVMPSEARSRDGMNRLVRRRMLEAQLECPSDVACELSWRGRIENIASVLSVLSFDWFLAAYLYDLLLVKLRISAQSVAAYFALGSVAVTAILYFYSVYVIDLLRGAETEEDKSAARLARARSEGSKSD